ncbi:MAG TPA: type II toxin-antitoxin system HicB family antitoxin [Pirellulales bacterium]|nr:type II toxin-antitoxin system HicB family antitoxin [Pirellulales bacterium]
MSFTGSASRRPAVASPVLKVYRVCVELIEEDDGFSAIACDLPGVASQGDTAEEALRNVAEAYAGAIKSYLHHGEEIPWEDARGSGVE